MEKRKLERRKKDIIIDKSTFKDEKKVELLIQDINEKVSKKEFELAIDRLHTFFKGYIETICEKLNIQIKNKSLDSLYGELLRVINDNDVFEEGVTKDILSSAKKVMKSFDFARNNRSFAHTNDIMKQNESEFLCVYIIDLFKFISKVDSKIKVKKK